MASLDRLSYYGTGLTINEAGLVTNASVIRPVWATYEDETINQALRADSTFELGATRVFVLRWSRDITRFSADPLRTLILMDDEWNKESFVTANSQTAGIWRVQLVVEPDRRRTIELHGTRQALI